MGIPWKLEEVFINVLLNSLDACEQEDTIEVETHYDAGFSYGSYHGYRTWYQQG